MGEGNYNIDNFARIATKFCTWCEEKSLLSTNELLTAQILLADLLSCVLRLDDNGIDEDSSVDDVSADEWKIVRERFSNLKFDGYWKVFDSFEKSEPVYCLLSDDISDIYSDVKEGLTHYEKGFFAEATWHWRFTFSTHWGRHLIGAQYAIHTNLSDY